MIKTRTKEEALKVPVAGDMWSVPIGEPDRVGGPTLVRVLKLIRPSGEVFKGTPPNEWIACSADGSGFTIVPCEQFTYVGYAPHLPVEQPAPVPNDHPAVWDLVVADMHARDALGRERYKTRLQPHNGRDALRDLYEEKLDACAYLRQLLYERDGR